MKKQLFIGALALASIISVAQNKTIKRGHTSNVARTSAVASLPASNLYTYNTFTAAYQNITGTVVSAGQKWDELIYQIPLGFNFKLYNTIGNTLSFGGGALFSFNNLASDTIITAAGPMFEDLCDRAFNPNTDSDGDPGGISPITYTTVGSVGSRICKVEVNNAGFYNDNNANSTSSNFVNFQAWFYETTNVIEYRFGTCSVPTPSACFYQPTGFACSLFDGLDLGSDPGSGSSLNSNSLNGPFASPAMVGMAPTFTDIITGTMQSGVVYQFTRTTITTVKSLANTANIKLYPNPAKDKLFISNISSDLTNATIEFYDVAGKQIHSEKLSAQIDLSEFNKGVYFVKVRTQNNQNIFVNKLIIAE